MTEPTHDPMRSARPPSPAKSPGPLRWTPGPDELRLPSEDEPPHELLAEIRGLEDAKREAEARAEASEARVAELEALIEKMQRG